MRRLIVCVVASVPFQSLLVLFVYGHHRQQCAGSMRHVHFDCLKTWMQAKIENGNPHPDKCEICQAPFQHVVMAAAFSCSPCSRPQRLAAAETICRFVFVLIISAEIGAELAAMCFQSSA